MREPACIVVEQFENPYVTAKEAGFDHLRAGLCLEPPPKDPTALPSRGRRRSRLPILIDEARIPLVIAGSDEASALGLERLAEIARDGIQHLTPARALPVRTDDPIDREITTTFERIEITAATCS